MKSWAASERRGNSSTQEKDGAKNFKDSFSIERYGLEPGELLLPRLPSLKEVPVVSNADYVRAKSQGLDANRICSEIGLDDCRFGKTDDCRFGKTFDVKSSSFYYSNGIDKQLKDNNVQIPLLRLPCARESDKKIFFYSKSSRSEGSVYDPRDKILSVQSYLPPDDKLLLLPLLKLPHQVPQPRFGYEKLIHRNIPSNECLPIISKAINKRISLIVGARLANRRCNSADVDSNRISRVAASKTPKPKEKAALIKRERMENIDIIKEIGRGSYGSVWLVSRLSDQRMLVLKSVDLTRLNSEEEDSARQEVRILAGLKHPNIVSYKGSFELEHHLHLLMTYCEGGDLYTKIRQQHKTLFPEQQIIRWFIQITMALQYLHCHNILHRDLKTHNIFLTRSGLIKLGDFGIARVLNSSVDMATTMIGTPYYMSPELFAGIPYSYKSDIWSLGCCLYELTTLKHAFHARDMSALICRISRGKVEGVPTNYTEDLRNLIHSLMSRNPNFRPGASQILHKPFIRSHISAFLRDTTKPTHLSTKISDDESAKDVDGLARNEKDHEPTSDDIAKSNPQAKRCCENFQSEFESLHIAGGKMKLEDRSRIEPKPNGVKECHCERRERRKVRAASHIGSESRRRRRDNKLIPNYERDELVNAIEGEEYSQCLSEENLSMRRPLSARERRRKKRFQETETEEVNSACDRFDLKELEEIDTLELKDSESSCDEISETDTCRLNVMPSTEDSLIPKSEEVNDFVSFLDTTLNDSSTSSNLFSSNTEGGNSDNSQASEVGIDLDCRVVLLEETLMKEIGKERAALIVSLVKSGSWEDWEEQRKQACKILGAEVFTTVATTVNHLKLCYCFLQE